MGNEKIKIETDYSPFLIPLARKLEIHNLFCDPNNIRYTLDEQEGNDPEASDSLQESIQTVLRDPDSRLLIFVLTNPENPDEKVTDEEIELLAAYLQGLLLNTNAKYYRQPPTAGSIIPNYLNTKIDYRDTYSTTNPEEAKIFGISAREEDTDGPSNDYSAIPISVVPTHTLLVRRVKQSPANGKDPEIIMQVERLLEVDSAG
jgi:hypothetical protein